MLELPEGLEDPIQVLGRDPHAGVPDLKVELLARGPRADANVSLVRELHRVGAEVEEDVTELAGVGPQHAAVLRRLHPEVDPLPAGERLDDRAHLFHQVAHRDRGRVHRRPTGLQARMGEHLLDELQEVAGAGQDPLHVPCVRLRNRLRHAEPEEVRVADDRVQGRAELVADSGQELGLGAARRLRLLAGADELRDVHRVEEDSGDAAVGLDEGLTDEVEEELAGLAVGAVLQAEPRLHAPVRLPGLVHPVHLLEEALVPELRQHLADGAPQHLPVADEPEVGGVGDLEHMVRTPHHGDQSGRLPEDAPEPGALDLERLDESLALGLDPLGGGHVDHLDHRAHLLAVPDDRAGRALHREEAAVLPDEDLLVVEDPEALRQRAVDRALLDRIGAAVGMRVVDRIVEASVPDFLEDEAGQPLGRRIHVGAVAAGVHHEESGRGVLRNGAEEVVSLGVARLWSAWRRFRCPRIHGVSGVPGRQDSGSAR